MICVMLAYFVLVKFVKMRLLQLKTASIALNVKKLLGKNSAGK